MEFALILLKQITTMFVLISIGFICYKNGQITEQGSKDLTNLLLKIALPVVVVNNFLIEKTPEKVEWFFQSLLIAIITFLVAATIAYLFFSKRDGVANFAASFSNCGFFGIPLVSAVLGSQALFYISPFIAIINLTMWTYGLYIMTNDISVMKPKAVLTNPVVIAVFVGVIIFFSGITLPSLVVSTLSTIGSLNTPLAMILVGVFLAKSDLLAALKNKRTYLLCLVRLVVIPLVTMAIMYVIPAGNTQMKLAILIASSCPTGSNISMMAQSVGCDYRQATEYVCLTTLLCLLTIPVVISIGSMIL